MSYFLEFLVTAIALFFGVRTDFWGLVEDPNTIVIASLSLSIALLILTDRIAAGIRESFYHKNIAKLVKEQATQVPRYDVIREFMTSDEAMDYLCSRIAEAKVVVNTKISNHAVSPLKTVGKRYEDALVKSLKNGLIYKDLVSKGFKDYAEQMEKLAAGTKGKYEFRVATIDAPSFLNFIVLEFRSGEAELLIGWATSDSVGTEQRAFRILDDRVINYFKAYHSSLYR